MELPAGVTLDKLLALYEKHQRRTEAMSEWLKTDEGKEYNRRKAREYYARHKEEVLAKRAKRYEEDRETLLERSNKYYQDHAEILNEKARARRAAKADKSPA